MELLDHFMEAVAPDQGHHVEGAAVGVSTQAVDRDDPGMLEASGDLGLAEEPGLAPEVLRVLAPDRLERDFTVEALILGDENLAQAPAGVAPEDLVAEPNPAGAVLGVERVDLPGWLGPDRHREAVAGRSGIGAGLGLAERGEDALGVFGELLEVFRRGRPLAAAAPPGHFQSEQLAEQGGTGRPGD